MPPLPALRRSPRRRLLVAAVVLAIGGTGYALLFGSWGASEPATFVPNESCFLCHTDQKEAWIGSHHDLAMDHATDETVLGDFDDATFEHFGVTSRFYRRHGKFLVETDGPDGKLTEFEVSFVFGVTPLQQYLIELEGGRLQTLQISWDTEKKRWFHIYDEPTPAGDVLHWTSSQFNWNFMCAECHSTNLQRNYDPKTNAFHTTWSDIDVGCQACHGPGSAHNEWARSGGKKEDGGSMGLTVRLKDAQAQVDHCARCHSRRLLVSETYAFGDTFFDHYVPQLLIEPLYFPDGQILDEVYVHGSFLQTKKYHQGVTCTDCHDPHTARLKREGDKTCTHCHQPDPPKRFPTIKRKSYDTKEHHFHPADKPGTACVDCHMVARTYMGNDPRRDHSFRVPRPDLTTKIGTPNACNGCHDDKTPEWAVAEIVKRHPGHVDERVNQLHFGQVFAAARAGHAESLPALRALLLDKERPAIVRATAAFHLAADRRPDTLESLGAALEDEDPLVRGTAIAGVAQIISQDAPDALRLQRAERLAPLLEDPTRWVRTEAARALADLPREQIPAAYRNAFDAALEEWLARQRGQVERAETHLTLGAFHEARGDPQAAERAYLQALRLDPAFGPVRFNLAVLYNRQGRNTEAIRQLRALLAQDADDGEAWYSLGLLLAELGQGKEAADALGRAAKQLPDRPRIARNYAYALQKVGRLDEAHAAFRRASDLAPGSGDVLMAWGLLAIERRDEAHVESIARQLQALGGAGGKAARELRSRWAREKAR